jgi:hypothetical protein
MDFSPKSLGRPSDVITVFFKQFANSPMTMAPGKEALESLCLTTTPFLRLLQVRQHTLSKKMLILETYFYLQDAEAKSFYHESMMEQL